VTLPTKTFAQMLSDMTTAWAQNINLVPALEEGDALYAIFEAVTAQLNFLQGLAQTAVALSRAQTSTGADLDSFFAQFNFIRLPADYADGTVALGTLLPATNQIIIPIGTVVQTTGGAVQYQLVADTTQAAYNATLNAYVLSIGQTTINATAQALVAGSSSNVTAGQLVQLGTQVAGLATVTNAAPINNGEDAESDSAFRARFVVYLGSLAQATEAAIQAAALGVQQGLSVNLLENINSSGGSQAGVFTVVVNDGSGNPPSQLLNNVYNAVFAARAFTVEPFVIGPTSVTATIVLAIRIAAGYTTSVVETAVKNAIASYVNELGEGVTLYVSQVEFAALGVPGVTSVKPANTTINGVQADLTCTSTQTINTTTGAITVTTY